MNLLSIDKELKQLQLRDIVLCHQYEPQYKIKGFPRHTYFNDLEKDFKNEINVFRFSPYIQEKYSDQQNNAQIKKYLKLGNENNLLNFIKSSNAHGDKENKIEKPSTKGGNNATKTNNKNSVLNKLMKQIGIDINEISQSKFKKNAVVKNIIVNKNKNIASKPIQKNNRKQNNNILNREKGHYKSKSQLFNTNTTNTNDLNEMKLKSINFNNSRVHNKAVLSNLSNNSEQDYLKQNAAFLFNKNNNNSKNKKNNNNSQKTISCTTTHRQREVKAQALENFINKHDKKKTFKSYNYNNENINIQDKYKLDLNFNKQLIKSNNDYDNDFYKSFSNRIRDKELNDIEENKIINIMIKQEIDFLKSKNLGKGLTTLRKINLDKMKA